MLHYFNPGHEQAVLTDSPHRKLPANPAKMQRDLAFLPAWYAKSTDYVLVEDELSADFIQSIDRFDLSKPVTLPNLLQNPNPVNEPVSLWGISPPGIHFFRQLNEKSGLNLSVPEQSVEYRALCSRRTAAECLEFLIRSNNNISRTILPTFRNNIEVIDRMVEKETGVYLIKAPYSSSGRGLLRIFDGKIIGSERQILSGMLRKQREVSIESFLNKKTDFSMQFVVTDSRTVDFIGLSLFKTNEKGAYSGSFVGAQEKIESVITSDINPVLLNDIKRLLSEFIKEKIAPFYVGNIGTDLMVYEENNRLLLHPCVEINLRKNMGFLAFKLYEKYLNKEAEGFFQIDFHSQPGEMLSKHNEMKEIHPLVFDETGLKKGYLSLCPVNRESKYRAFLLIED